MTISNEAVEVAAKAAESCHNAWGTWEDVARAALEAAAPLIQAEALARVEKLAARWEINAASPHYDDWVLGRAAADVRAAITGTVSEEW